MTNKKMYYATTNREVGKLKVFTNKLARDIFVKNENKSGGMWENIIAIAVKRSEIFPIFKFFINTTVFDFINKFSSKEPVKKYAISLYAQNSIGWSKINEKIVVASLSDSKRIAEDYMSLRNLPIISEKIKGVWKTIARYRQQEWISTK